MPLAVGSFPITTPFDPAEDPPGSIDPLGTLAHAERLAELLLPGLTVRMWRARLLTIATIAAHVAERAVRHLDEQEDARLEARLAFERFAVSAIIRIDVNESRSNRYASKRLPGSELARSALAAGEPLTKHNFLKGEAINGPYGVIARLAMQLGLVDSDGRLGQQGINLLLAWAEDRGLPGILDDDAGNRRPGASWVEDIARQVAKWVRHQEWPGRGAGIWRKLGDALRLDELGTRERHVLRQLMEQDAARGRILGILRQKAEVYRQHNAEGRGVAERSVLLQAVTPSLSDDPLDRMLGSVCFAANVYETASIRLQEAFDAILWGLKQLGGRTSPADLAAQPAVHGKLEKARIALKAGTRALEAAIQRLRDQSESNRTELIEPILRLRDEVSEGTASSNSFLDMLVRRHERVQKEKRKGPWFDRDTRWTLLPGFGIGGDQPPEYGLGYIHPFRVVNAYALLADTGAVNLENAHGEE